MEVFKDLARVAYAAADWVTTHAIQAVNSPNPDGWSDADVAHFAIVGAIGIAGLALAAVLIPKWRRDLAEQRPNENDDTSQRTHNRERVS